MCKISLAPSGQMALEIPSPSGGSHTVEIPFTPAGIDALRRILRKQKEAVVRHEKTLGSDASPNAYQIEKFLREKSAAEVARKGAISSEILSDLDLTLDL